MAILKREFILIIFLFSTSFCRILERNQQEKCQNEFPLKETVSLLKEIVKDYGERRNERDQEGNEYSSILIDQHKKIKINGREFRLNTPEDKDSTFHLRVLELLDEEVFIIPSHLKALWSTRYPDRTYLLHKITFDCAKGEVACGLQCCSERSKSIQAEFVEEINRKRRFRRSPTRLLPKRYENDYQVTLNEITYSLEPKAGMNCRFRLSQFDDLYLRRADFKIMTDTIYYKCPTGHGCCSLGCTPISRFSIEIQPPTSAEYSVQSPQEIFVMAKSFFEDHSMIIYLMLILLLGLLFTVILYQHFKKVKASIALKPGALIRNRRHKTTETQTSKLSLNLDSPNLTSLSMDELLLLRTGINLVDNPRVHDDSIISIPKRPHSMATDIPEQAQFDERSQFIRTPPPTPDLFPGFDFYSRTWNPKRTQDSNPYQSTTLPRNSVTTFKPISASRAI